MRISNAGRDFIIREEGMVLRTYRCQAGVLTIGVGHTGPDVMEDMVISEHTAKSLFTSDVARFEACVNKAGERPQCEFDALVSFAFNVGTGNFLSSTMFKLLLKGESSLAAEEFPRWNKAKGKVLPVLTRRRAREKRLFLEGRYT